MNNLDDKHDKKRMGDLMEKYKKICFGLIFLYILFIVAGCQNQSVPPSSMEQITPTPKPVEKPVTQPAQNIPVEVAPPKKIEPIYSMKECNYLSSEDIQNTLSLKEVVFKDTPTRINNSETRCNRLLAGYNEKTTSEMTVKYDITITSSEDGTKENIISLCKNGQSLSLGEYTACTKGSMIYYGKGTYLVWVQCNGCEDGKNLEIAKLLENRLG
jgi:hypothetical protein